MADAPLSPSKPTQHFAPAAASELAALKTRQQVAWSSGDYAVVGTTLQIVGEQLCEALDLRPGRKVLDVAAGNGMASSGGGAALVCRDIDRLCAGLAGTRPRTGSG